MNRLGWLGTDAPPPEKAPTQETVSPAEDAPASEKPPPQVPEVSETRGEPVDPVREPARRGPRQTGQIPARTPSDENLLTMASADYAEFHISPDLGGILRATLLRYRSADRQSIKKIGTGDLPFCTLVSGNRQNGLETPTVTAASESRVTLERRSADGTVVVQETWEADPQRPYQVHYSARFRNEGKSPLDLGRYLLACGSIAPESGGDRSRLARAGAISLAVDVAFARQDQPENFTVKDVRKMDDDEATELERRRINWLAVHSKYFLFYLRPENDPLHGCWLEASPEDQEGKDTIWAYAGLDGRTVQPGSETVLDFTAYGGPKKYNLLKEMGGGIESVMRLNLFLFFHPRWMGWITKRILQALVTLNDFFNHRWGYGFAIVVITIVIKMLFWPLTHRSTVSMRKMQKIQPQIKEIREKYKDQPQKMQQKTMELYREYGVNPMGGCLPILLQIPVFFALFNTLRGAIELRHASFLWVHDLSMPDTLPFEPFGLPVRPLAIFMGVSMLAQQHMMPTSADPQQKKVMTFMSLFFIVILYGMPAGLTLYWSVNQVLTIVQNIISRKLEKSGETGAAA